MRTSRYLCYYLLTMVLLCGNAVHAQWQELTERVRLQLRNTTGLKVITALDEQSSYSFILAMEQLKEVPIPVFDANNITLGAALQQLQVRYGFEFAVRGNTIAVKLRAVTPPASGSRVNYGQLSGKVVDEDNGKPVLGATIRIGDKGAVTDMEGSYQLRLPEGRYAALVSAIGYATKEITDIAVMAEQSFMLNVSLRKSKGQLKSVLITASARKESVHALLLRQKNAAEITNGISAEEISRTPDKNIGESLKRISGVSTNDEKYVIVRGIGERYNAAMLDGVALPSTEAQSRNFSFDLIPSNLIDNVVVSKTVTPDMNASFGGGLIQINTKDIPTSNFTSLSAGVSVNDQTLGKDFFSRARGRYDYLGFDDGHRGHYPTNLRPTQEIFYPAGVVPFNIHEQSMQFRNNDNFTTYKYPAVPSQNYQLTLGRSFRLDSVGRNKLGYTASLSYRNTQSIVEHEDLRRGDWSYISDGIHENKGATYNFVTTIRALLNVGWQAGTNRFSFRNTYTRMFNNGLVRTFGYNRDNGMEDPSLPPMLRESDDPIFLDLLQNKLSGQHVAGKVKIEWDLARTGITRNEKDVIITSAGPVKVGSKYEYFYSAGGATEPKEVPMSRSFYRNQERHYTWALNASVPFSIGQVVTTMKAGYAGNQKQARFNWQIAAVTTDRYTTDSLTYLPVGQWGDHMADSTGFTYSISPYAVDYYEGSSQTHAGFVMFDHQLLRKLRLIWGVRAEYYQYRENKNPSNTKLSFYVPQDEQPWQWMPSANLTYHVTSAINLRASWSNSAVRPELMDNGRFNRYSPYYDGQLMTGGVVTTRISSYDVKAEWYPGAGEVISVGVFHKYFDKPVEMVVNVKTGNLAYVLQNSDWAKVDGLEIEARKNLAFISPGRLLSNITLFGNLTLQKSTVQSRYVLLNSSTGKEDIYVYKTARELYGQVPFLLNAGVSYSGRHFGFNVAYNKAGYKTNLVSDNPSLMERERPREQLDIQVSYKLLKNKMEVRLNAGNLLNSPYRFYRNLNWEEKPDFHPTAQVYEWSDRFAWKPGFSEKYEEGDVRSFTRFTGRTYSMSISYNF